MKNTIEDDITFAELIRKARIAKGVSLCEAARHLNFDKSGLSRMENGTRLPRTKNLMRISTYYDIDIKDLQRVILNKQNDENK